LGRYVAMAYLQAQVDGILLIADNFETTGMLSTALV